MFLMKMIIEEILSVSEMSVFIETTVGEEEGAEPRMSGFCLGLHSIL